MILIYDGITHMFYGDSLGFDTSNMGDRGHSRLQTQVLPPGMCIKCANDFWDFSGTHEPWMPCLGPHSTKNDPKKERVLKQQNAGLPNKHQFSESANSPEMGGINHPQMVGLLLHWTKT